VTGVRAQSGRVLGQILADAERAPRAGQQHRTYGIVGRDLL
jgi:hypothetical protein